MTVHAFKKPELDEEILTAMEQLRISEGALTFFTEQYRSIRLIRDGVLTGATRASMAMLNEDIASLEQEMVYARDAVENWQDILDVLTKRTARL